MTDLLASYRAAGPGHDEMLQSTGATRAAWDQMADLAGIDSWERLALRREDVTLLLEDHGVRYGSDPEVVAWPLDPLPVIIDEHEWIALEGRLQQRAELLDAVMTDLVTERTLLTRGLLPAEVVLPHPGFLRAADGITIPGPHQLFTHAVDVARTADGSWRAIADRTQAPSGMGFAMEDRRVIAQVLAGLYRQARIRRVGPFFHSMRHALHEVAPPGAGGNPRIALLTPGPYSETSFDQGYLSTMLGFPLVQGEDLVVADGRVWMRSLDELEPVDVIVRRVDADYCDPLDLLGSSVLGVPGLVETARSGAVTIVNPLGSGILENPALLTYLPRLCRELLGEELALPSAVTYWCGERSMCSHVIANLERLVVRSTLPGEASINGWELTASERADLSVRISIDPHEWVGQEPIEASTTPTVGDGSLHAGSTVLRTFAVARTQGYEVMSGALARVTGGADTQTSADTTIGRAVKDVWVLSAQTQPALEPWLDEEPDVIAPRGRWASSISPGAAEELYWFGRYTERSEAMVRLLRAVVDRWEDYHPLPRSTGGRALAVLMEALERIGGTRILSDLLLAEDVEGSVAYSLTRSTRAATAVRDQLSPDTWLALSSIDRALQRERGRQARGIGTEGLGLDRALARCLEGLLALSGIGAESMVRDVGWWLMDVGRRIERAQHVVQVLGATVTQRRSAIVDSMVFESVLIAHESVITFRRRSQTNARLDTFLELMLLDDANPRSLIYQLEEIRTNLGSLPAGGPRVAARDQLLADLHDLLLELDPVAVIVADADGHRPRLAEVLESLRWRLAELGREIARAHFSHPTATPWADASGTWTTGSAS